MSSAFSVDSTCFHVPREFDDDCVRLDFLELHLKIEDPSVSASFIEDASFPASVAVTPSPVAKRMRLEEAPALDDGQFTLTQCFTAQEKMQEGEDEETELEEKRLQKLPTDRELTALLSAFQKSGLDMINTIMRTYGWSKNNDEGQYELYSTTLPSLIGRMSDEEGEGPYFSTLESGELMKLCKGNEAAHMLLNNLIVTVYFAHVVDINMDNETVTVFARHAPLHQSWDFGIKRVHWWPYGTSIKRQISGYDLRRND